MLIAALLLGAPLQAAAFLALFVAFHISLRLQIPAPETPEDFPPL